MEWYNFLILIGLLGLFGVLVYNWSFNVPENNVQNVTNLNYKYYFVVQPKYGNRMCPYEYPAFNDAVLVNGNGTPLNISYGTFIGADGYYDTKELPTCVCDSYYSNISGCKVNETVYQNMTVFVVTDYKVMEKEDKFSCEVDSDCVPATCCHATACVNKAFAPNCTHVMCTMNMVPGTLDYGHCGCVDGVCQAIIKNPIAFE